MRQISISGRQFSVNDNVSNFWQKVDDYSWERETFNIFEEFIEEGHPYIDIGAWIGPTVLYGSQIAKHCYAVEPDPVAMRELKENIDLNPELKKKITLFQGCINDSDGKVDLKTDGTFGDSMSSMVIGESKGSVSTEAITFEKFVEMNDITDCRFIKMDIEGGESVVLPTMKDYLEKNKPTLHLSLHSFWFRNFRKDCEAILDVLKIYKNIYDNKGNLLDLDTFFSDVLIGCKAYDIVATDKEWKVPEPETYTISF